jgi:acyl-CoA oxidase
LAQLIYGSEHLSRMQRILPLVENEPAFCKKKLHYMSRLEKFDFAVKKVSKAQLLFCTPSLAKGITVIRKSALRR